MASANREGLDLRSSSTSSNGSAVSAALDSLTSATTSDPFTNLQDSTESSIDPTLPKLPSFLPSTVNQKRNRDEYLASSSDAPLFSSDDLPASSAEKYEEPRVKRQHRRPWYETEDGWRSVSAISPIKKPRMKGPFKRTHDSGVWLASDDSMEDEETDRQDAVRRTLRVMENGGSIDGDDELWHEDEKELDLGERIHGKIQTLEEKLQQALVNKALQLTEDLGGFEGPVFPYWQKQPDNLMGFHSTQSVAQKKVVSCVEEGGEVVDLSYVFIQRALLLALKMPKPLKLL